MEVAEEDMEVLEETVVMDEWRIQTLIGLCNSNTDLAIGIS